MCSGCAQFARSRMAFPSFMMPKVCGNKYHCKMNPHFRMRMQTDNLGCESFLILFSATHSFPQAVDIAH